MEQHKLLKEYLEIFSRFSANGLSKQQRKQRHVLLSTWEKNIYSEPLPTLEELEEFRKLHGNYCLNPIFVRKAIVQTVQKDIEAGGIEGIRFLFRCFQGHEGTYCSTNNVLYMFCEALGFEYDPRLLADKLLDLDPDNEFAVKYKYHTLKYFLEFSLHEMPTGVLNGMDGADIDDIPGMLLSVDEFQVISNRLGYDDKVLINECRIFYPAYKEYLQCYTQYNGFEDYLIKNEVLNHEAY